MSNLPHQYSKSLEVMVMFEPHRLQHQFLRAAYASLVPVSAIPPHHRTTAGACSME